LGNGRKQGRSDIRKEIEAVEKIVISGRKGKEQGGGAAPNPQILMAF
jgi:hypothetical protein